MPPSPKLRAIRPDDPEPDLVVIRSSDLKRLIKDAVESALGSRPQEPALLDRERLAKALCVSLPTIDRLRRSGMPTTWVIQAPRFVLPEVVEWLRARAPENAHAG